jgi:non-homologous end joining protein Ku
MPASLWSGNLRLSLVLIPVKLHSAVSTEDAVSFRMIHEPSGKPIRYVKGIPTEHGFEEVPEDAVAVHEYLRAKVEQRAPEVTIESEGKPAPQVINIMDALKKSMQK